MYIDFILIHLLSLEDERDVIFDRIVDYVDWGFLEFEDINKFRWYWKRNKEKLQVIIIDNILNYKYNTF